MNIAFGKCNAADPAVEQRLDNTLDVAFWIDVLGLRTIEVGSHLLLRPELLATKLIILKISRRSLMELSKLDNPWE